MGYTHYWDHTDAFTTDEWNQITDKVNKIVNWCQNNKIPLQYEYDMVMPVLNDSHQIRFNGVGDDGHETFMIKRVPSKTWDFCKTARKPYDVAVGCCLVLLQSVNGNKFKFRSDGDYDDWADVVDAYEEIFGEKPENFLNDDEE